MSSSLWIDVLIFSTSFLYVLKTFVSCWCYYFSLLKPITEKRFIYLFARK